MRVGVLTAGCDGGRSGIGRYAQELLRRTERAPAGTDFHLLVPAGEEEVWLEGRSAVSSTTIPSWAGGALASVAWTQTGLPIASRRQAIDVLFLPAANRRVPLVAGVPTVGTVHDLAAFHLEAKYDPARMFYIRRVLPRLIRRLTHVVTVSDSSRRDIIEHAGVAPERVSVVPNAIDPDRFSPARDHEAERRVTGALGVRGDYLLYVSRIEHPAKNHVRLIEAYEHLRGSGLRHSLVLAGPDRERAEEVHARAAASPYADGIVFTGFLADDDLPHLYRAAACAVVPSLWEGFGLPVLEAMACGVPVACSNAGSLPEVAGTDAIVFDPYNYRDIAASLHPLLTDCGASDHYRRAGLRRSRDYSWAKTSDATWRIIDQVARAGRHRAAGTEERSSHNGAC